MQQCSEGYFSLEIEAPSAELLSDFTDSFLEDSDITINPADVKASGYLEFRVTKDMDDYYLLRSKKSMTGTLMEMAFTDFIYLDKAASLSGTLVFEYGEEDEKIGFEVDLSFNRGWNKAVVIITEGDDEVDIALTSSEPDGMQWAITVF